MLPLRAVISNQSLYFYRLVENSIGTQMGTSQAHFVGGVVSKNNYAFAYSPTTTRLQYVQTATAFRDKSRIAKSRNPSLRVSHFLPPSSVADVPTICTGANSSRVMIRLSRIVELFSTKKVLIFMRFSLSKSDWY